MRKINRRQIKILFSHVPDVRQDRRENIKARNVKIAGVIEQKRIISSKRMEKKKMKNEGEEKNTS